ncbi:phage tail sheath subtilisin-like domain-containing protein [Clostridium magnum]|uniref:Phage tail sheath protein n=1 Tax=Clostridium magnum DSM 2767 TaxID=1121326 RepID=A0A162UWU2_9CLOT|nr:phage tail sheath subtilisin-like domain-containing protein [Clostridium magnum]KZL94367.1 phage tail sheath protein [Clostridium magnum DSM 2767]SHJ49834.1 Phage tail sheath protein [Clostridium magnum DSM 2767]
MGLPNIEIIFKSLATSAVARGERGIVAMIIKDTIPAPLTNPIVMTSNTDIPSGLSTENKAEIQRVFIGYVNPPIKVIAYVIATDAVDYTAAQTYLETVKWDYVCVPSIVAGEVTAFASWIKSCRDTKGLKVKAVLPNCTADHEGIINLATDDIKVGSETYTAAQYCSRIAGIIAGTPLYMAATYAPLPEVTDVPHHTKAEFDALIDAGKLVLMNDGEKIKIARAVNSLVTTTADKGADFKKIKIVDIIDLIYSDIRKTYDDNYVGKVPNDYDHKCLLITAINAYLEGLELQQLLDRGKNAVGIDMESQKLYLKGQGTDVDTMKDQEIKEANTGSSVLLAGTTRPLDAMEDLVLNLYM